MTLVTRYPSAYTQLSGTWTNQTNLAADDGAVCSITRGTVKNSQDDIRCQSFGFDGVIPTGSTINSVAIEVEHMVATTSNLCFLENFASISGVAGAVNSDSAEPTTLTQRIYSSYARPGGGGWTRADLLDGVLTVTLRARNGNNATSNTWSWDYVRVVVDYTEPVVAPDAPTNNAATNLKPRVLTANWTQGSGGTPTYYEVDAAYDSGFTSFVTGWNAKNVGNVTSVVIGYPDATPGVATTIYTRVRAGNGAGESAASNTRTETLPAGTSPLAGRVPLLWFRASDIGGLSDTDPIPSITDVSGHGGTWSQATSSMRPQYRTNMLGGQPAIVGDGTDDRFDNASNFWFENLVDWTDGYIGRLPTSAADATHNIVSLLAGGSSHELLRVQEGTVGWPIWYLRDFPEDAWEGYSYDETFESRDDTGHTFIHAYDADASQPRMRAYIDGVAEGTRSSHTGTIAKGAGSGNLLDASAYELSEYIVFPDGLTSTEVAELQEYWDGIYFEPPGAPVTVAPLIVGSTAVLFKWAAPGTGGPPTSYEIDVATDSGFTSFVTGYNDLDVGNVLQYRVTGLTANTAYWFRVRAKNAVGTGTNSNVQNPTTITTAHPYDYTGMRMWLKADDTGMGYSDNDPVTDWKDRSYSGNDVAQATSSKRPTYKTNILNGLDAIRFGGTDDDLTKTGLGTPFDITDFTVFVLYRNNSDIQAALAVIGGYDDGGRSIRLDSANNDARLQRSNLADLVDGTTDLPSDVTNPHIVSIRSTVDASGEHKIYVDGVEEGSATGTFTWGTTNAGWYIGSKFNDFFFNGDMFEFIYYDTFMSTTDHSAVVTYLLTKWGLAGDIFPQTLSVISPGVVSMTRKTNKIASVTSPGMPTMMRAIRAVRSVVGASVVSLTKRTGKPLSVTSPVIPTLASARFYSRALDVIGAAKMELKKNVLKIVPVTSPLIPTLLKRITAIRGVTAASIPSLTKKTSTSKSLTSAVIPSLTKRAKKILSVVSPGVVSLTSRRVILQSLSVVGAVVPSVTKKVAAIRSVTAPVIPSLVKQAKKILGVTSPGVMSTTSRRVILKALSVVAASVPTLAKGARKIASVTAASVPTLLKRSSKSLSVTGPVVPSTTKKTGKRLSVTAPVVASLVRKTNKILSVLGRAVVDLVTVFIPAPGETFFQTISTTSASVVSLARKTGKRLSVTSPATLSLIKKTYKPLSVTGASQPTMTKRITHRLSVTAASVVSLTKRIAKSLSVTSPSIVILATRKLKIHILNVVGAVIPSLSRRPNKLLSVQAVSTPSVRKQTYKMLAATAPVSVTLRKLTSRTLSVIGNALVTLSRKISKGLFVEARGNVTVTSQEIEFFLPTPPINRRVVGHVWRSQAEDMSHSLSKPGIVVIYKERDRGGE